MRNLLNFVITGMLVLATVACEKTIELELPEPREYLVVHGQIEPDSLAYVSLSKNSPYFDPINLQLVASLLVNGALVTVSSDGVIDTLEPAFNFQHFTLFNYKGTKIRGQVGKTYTLRIQNADYDLEAITTIPAILPLDSLWHRSRADVIREAGQVQPTLRDEALVNLNFRYPDPPVLGNYVRAFTRRNSESQWSSDFNSIYSDDLVNGQSVDFVLRRGKEAYLFNDSLTFDEFGYFELGDTIHVKWSAIDKAHYTFWLTINSARGGSGNPFATPTIVATNIRGKRGKGLGIWGGYSSLHYTYIVEP